MKALSCGIWGVLLLTIKLRAVRLRAQTPVGEAGFDARFDSDLVIIRGANTVGKSLLLQSVLFALGMEDLYATRSGVLTRAMSTSIDIDGGTFPVLASYVELEVELAPGRIITLRRAVKPDGVDVATAAQLIRVSEGAYLTGQAGVGRREVADYYVSRPGAAVDEAGFHRFLADALGWGPPPKVPTYGDNHAPLYLQLSFALAYVEQKRGWGGTVPQVPTKYGIIEPLRRAVEYALDLDVIQLFARRREVDERVRALMLEESGLRSKLDALASLGGGRVSFPPLARAQATSRARALEHFEPLDRVGFEVLIGREWTPIDDRISELERLRDERARVAAERDVGRTRSPNYEGLQRQLSVAEEEVADLSAQLAALNQSDDMLTMQLGALNRRFSHVEEESRKYGQLATLARLGSELAESSFHDGDCPTCRQSLSGVESIEGNAMDVEQTRSALAGERETVLSMIDQVEQGVAGIEATRNAIGRRVVDARARVRALKSDLVSPEGFPSVGEIQVGLQQESERTALIGLQARLIVDGEQWEAVRIQLAAAIVDRFDIGPVELSEADQATIDTWTSGLQSSLSRFGFESAPNDSVEIDNSMKPVVEGFDISFQGSASDGIRLRWAYLLSLLQVALERPGHHAGFLMLDEPGQQGVQDDSLAALYAACVNVVSLVGAQILLTTSESVERLSRWVNLESVSLIDLRDGRLMQLLR